MDNIIFKIMLSAVIITSCAFTGSTLSKVDMRRSNILAETMDSLHILRIHMLEGLIPLSAALSKSEGYIMKTTGELMNDKSVSEAWKELSEKQTVRGGRLDSLTPYDRETLDRFFFRLGKTSREEQNKCFDTTIKELGLLENSARVSGLHKQRLYASLGALAGVTVVVLIA